MNKPPARFTTIEALLGTLATSADAIASIAQYDTQSLTQISQDSEAALRQEAGSHPSVAEMFRHMDAVRPAREAARRKAHEATFGNGLTFSGMLASHAHDLRDLLHREDALTSAMLGADTCEALHALCNDAESLARHTHIVLSIQNVCAMCDCVAATRLQEACTRMRALVAARMQKRFGEALARLAPAPRRVWDALEGGPASGAQLARRLHMSQTHVCNAILRIRQTLGAGAIRTSRKSGYSRADTICWRL